MASMRVMFVLALIFDAVEAANPIEQLEIEAVQKEWAAAVVNIGAKHKEGQSRDYIKALADTFVDGFYAYSIAPTLLKPSTVPTGTDVNASFCTNRDCAILHFIGESAEKPGHALQPWTAIRFENVGVLLQGDVAMAMGNSFFTDGAGVETRIENSFGYIRDSAGKIRISLHHASALTAGSGTAPVAAAAVDATTTTTTVVAEVATPVAPAAALDATTAVPEATSTAAPVAAEEITTTTTTTTTTVAPSTTKDWFFDGHSGGSNHNNKFHQMGRVTKAPSEMEGGGGFFGMLMKLIVLILVVVTLAITFFMSQVNSHKSMSMSDKFVAALSLMQRKVQKLVSKNSGGLPTNGGYGKDV